MNCQLDELFMQVFDYGWAAFLAEGLIKCQGDVSVIEVNIAMGGLIGLSEIDAILVG